MLFYFVIEFLFCVGTQLLAICILSHALPAST